MYLMQENLRLIMWTAVGVIAIWFIAMTVNRNIFTHANVARRIVGTVPMSKTDIGDKCGSEYVSSDRLVEFKLNSTGQIVYLCPQGLWPIQQSVIAITLSHEFITRLSPEVAARLEIYYPSVSEHFPNNILPKVTPPSTPVVNINNPLSRRTVPDNPVAKPEPVVTQSANPFIGSH
jgi:hypothetical protein